MAHNFEEDKELAKLFGLIFVHMPFDNLETSMALLQDSFPRSISNRDYIIGLLSRIIDEARENCVCKTVIMNALRVFRVSTDWDKAMAYNKCVMTELTKLSDEFFEEYATLQNAGYWALNVMLLKANLPLLPNVV